MFKLPYDTTPCRDYQMDKVVAALKRQFVANSGMFRYIDNPYKKGSILPVMELTPSPVDIPPFAHPVALTDLPGREKEVIFVTDVRNFVRVTPGGDVVVAAKLDYDTAVLRLMLQHFWYNNPSKDLLGLGHFPTTIFARWLSNALSRRLALAPEVQMRVTVICAYFYLCMFHERDEADHFGEKEKLKIAQMISRATHVNVEDTFRIIENFKLHTCAQCLVDELTNSAGSIRFEKFNLALLYSIVGGSWFGFNNRELVAVALEHPPTFIALVAQATQERGFHKTVFGELVKDYDRNDAAKQFILNVKHLPIQ